MRKIFIDCGAFDGRSIAKFQRKKHASEYEIFSFEPTPALSAHVKKKYKKAAVYNKAIWIKNGTMDFFVNPSNILSQGNSLIKEKLSGRLDKENPITVETIDLNEWILNNFSKEDYIILKIDIEGAEYEVLPHLIQGGCLDYIDEVYIEYHLRDGKKMPYEEYKDKHDDVIRKMEEYVEMRNDLKYGPDIWLPDWE